MSAPINSVARGLFAPVAPSYERWAAVLSLGQDRRWRERMVARLDLPPQSRVLDVAAGTGSIGRLLERRGCTVVALDQSPEMLRAARLAGPARLLAHAERLPFLSDWFDGLTFGYLLRYVPDPAACLRELARVVRPGGRLGMVEFGRPRGVWRPLWWLYTHGVLPLAGSTIGSGWREVGRFLGQSIDTFEASYPGDALVDLWRTAGLEQVRLERPSLGGGLVMWARRP